jgi:uncharacterized protein YjlB
LPNGETLRLAAEHTIWNHLHAHARAEEVLESLPGRNDLLFQGTTLPIGQQIGSAEAEAE